MTSQVYNLDGPKEFPFPYPVRAAAQLTVEIVPGNVVSPGDYEVVGVGPTSTQVTVRYPNAPTTGGLQLKISRYVAPERVTVIDDPSDITTVNLNAEFNNIYEALIDFEEFILNLVQQMLDDFQNDVLDPALVEITQLRNDAVAAKDAAEAAQQGAEEAEQGATAAWDAFQDRYWGAYPTDPSTSPVGNPPTAGDLYWNTTVNQWRAWDANQGAWVSVTSAVPTYYDRRNYVATEGQTTFDAQYDAGFVQVWVNGLLLPPSDYEASTGTEVVLDEGVAAGTEVTIVGLGSVVIGVLDGDIAVVTTLTGTQLLPDALDRRVAYVPDLPALRALTGMQEGQAVQITTTVRAGLFRWDDSDLSAEVASDPQMGRYVPPTGQDGGAGAWVKVTSERDTTKEQQSLLVRADTVVQRTNHYIIRRGSSQIGIGNAQNDDGVEYQFKIDDDGMLLMRGGIAAPLMYSGLTTDAQNLTGNFVTSSTSSTGNYAQDEGDTFDLPFTGTGLIFHHFADDRGGVWDVVIDGGAPIQISTWASVSGVSQTTVVTGLSSGAHTCTFTFAGDDPAHPPSSGAGNSRGWLILPNAVGYHTGTGIDESVPLVIEATGTNRRAVMSPSSVPEFALNVSPSGSGLSSAWVPQHGTGGAGACRGITRKIIIDGVDIGSDISAISEVSAAIDRVTIVQSYTAYNANDVSGDYPLWEGVLCHDYRDGILSVSHTMTTIGEFSCAAGYLNMFPSDTRYVSTFRNGSGYEKSVTAVNQDTVTPYSLSAAFLSDTGDAALFDSDLPGGVGNGAPLLPGEVFLQERVASFVAKYYLRSFNGSQVPPGHRFTSRARYLLCASNEYVGAIAS